MGPKLDVVSVNSALVGTDWLAVGNPTDTGFDLVQLEAAVNDGAEDLDLCATTDSLPVLSAKKVSGGVRFTLNTEDEGSKYRVLVIKTAQQVEAVTKIAA